GIMRTFYTILISIVILGNIEAAWRKPSDIELKEAEPCSQEKCQPPNCRCSGMTLPKAEFKGHEKEIPQFITVTFDDAVTGLNYLQYQELFNNLKNPDHCEVKATFYVSHEYTDYTKLNALYNEGHEIALHSITHGAGTEYWRQADVDLLMREFGNQIDILERFAKINRKPSRACVCLSYKYGYRVIIRMWLLNVWACYTIVLGLRNSIDCQIPPCPTASLPGLWVNPMVTWVDMEGYSCSMLDGCIYLPEDKVDSMFEWMKENFHRHYDNNRAPFGMYLHAAWFGRSPNYIKAFRKFLEYANSLPDVYITTPTSVVQYLRHPTLGKPFKGCFKKPQTTCRPVTCSLQKQSTGETRYMTVCDRCPEVYPWLDNPLGEL
ncbi:hypothetical protein DOY81_009812, partial [Sarcophaga bullata]